MGTKWVAQLKDALGFDKDNDLDNWKRKYFTVCLWLDRSTLTTLACMDCHTMFGADDWMKLFEGYKFDDHQHMAVVIRVSEGGVTGIAAVSHCTTKDCQRQPIQTSPCAQPRRLCLHLIHTVPELRNNRNGIDMINLLRCVCVYEGRQIYRLLL